MIGWGFLGTRRWVGYIALSIVFAIVCCLLGFWQLSRRAEAEVEIDRVATNYELAAVPVASVLPKLSAYDSTLEWTPVTVTGTYLVDDQLLARNRPYGGNPGFEVLTPLLADDGTVFVIDRGWVPIGNRQDSPDEVPAAPAGRVTVEARLAAGEPALTERTAPPGQIASIDLGTIAHLVGKPTYTGAYGLLASEDPSPATVPLAQPKPVPDEGPHLSYAFQWFVFALLGFVGLGYLARQEFRALNADDPEERERAEERLRKAAAKPLSDSEIEDAAVDASN